MTYPDSHLNETGYSLLQEKNATKKTEMKDRQPPKKISVTLAEIRLSDWYNAHTPTGKDTHRIKKPTE